MKFLPVLFASAAIALLSFTRLNAQTPFIDDTMDAFHFQTFFIGGSPPGYPPGDLRGTVNASIDSIFGNPGSSLLVQLTHTNIPPAASTLATAILDTGALWSPLVNGVIKDISFSVDVFTNDPGVQAGFAIFQGNGGSAFWPFPAVTTGSWTTVSINNLSPSEFRSINFTTGAPITFGVSPLTSNASDPALTDYSVYFDNFKVQVDTIPEPASCALWLGLGAAALILVRGRRRFEPRPIELNS
jgi:hypothetical protein